MIIIIEGPPASGKSTLLSNIKEKYKDSRINLITEFGSGQLGQIIHKNITTQGSITDDPVWETFILFANALEKQNQIDKKKINIMDTFIDAIKAHQVVKIGQEMYSKIEQIFKPYLLKPDVYIFLNSNPKTLLSRIRQRSGLLNCSSKDFFMNVFAYYKKYKYISIDSAENKFKKIYKTWKNLKK
jgi:thymidylate kinase